MIVRHLSGGFFGWGIVTTMLMLTTATTIVVFVSRPRGGRVVAVLCCGGIGIADAFIVLIIARSSDSADVVYIRCIADADVAILQRYHVFRVVLSSLEEGCVTQNVMHSGVLFSFRVGKIVFGVVV